MWSTPARALGRCAITTTMPPRVAHSLDRPGQRLLALVVEIGVRLVEHDEERIAVERAGQADALALAAGQAGTALADLRLVAVRQAQDHLVDVGSLGGRDHRLRPSGRHGSGRCSAPPFRRTARRPAADSRCAARDPPAAIARAPRRRGGPCRARSATRRRACGRATTCRRRSGR